MSLLLKLIPPPVLPIQNSDSELGCSKQFVTIEKHKKGETRWGVVTPTEAREKRTKGGFCHTALYLDAKSVYSAITASVTKTPAEKSLLTHVLYLRELLDTKVIQYLAWVDTRDMAADGLTKGAVSRESIHNLMSGSIRLNHESAVWSSKAQALLA